jgi:hypothetical protein
VQCAKEGTKEQKLALLKYIERVSGDKQDEILCVLAKDNDGEVRKSVRAYLYLPEKAWVNMVKKASSDEAEVLEIIHHPKCPEAVLDTILSNKYSALYSDRVFIDALSTDRAIKKLKIAGFIAEINYNRLVFGNKLPPDAETSNINFDRIRRLHKKLGAPITNIFERTW